MKFLKNTIYRFLIGCLLFVGIGTLHAHPGIGIVMDSKGNVFYTDLSHVWKITTDGQRTIAVKNVHTHELYIDQHDNLYGEHEWYKGDASGKWANYVWCLTRDGKIEIVAPEIEGFLENTTLVRDAKGNSYWVKKAEQHQIMKSAKGSKNSSVLSKHKFQNIRWMYFSKADNHLYVVDNLKIKKVSTSGEIQIVSGNLKENAPPHDGVADHHYVYGLCADTNKNVYAAIFGANKVKRIDTNGVVKTIHKSEKGWSPCGVLIAPDNSKWIMEFSKNNKTRVLKISPDGTQKIYGGSA
jgi:sugar lactone lactonase YvrE